MENNLKQNSLMDQFVKTDNILNDMCGIIESSQKAAYQAVNIALVQRNWLIGYRIAEEELRGQKRSEYGAEVIKNCQRILLKNMVRDLQKQTCIVFIHFINAFLRFSTQRVENLRHIFLGLIIVRFCK